MAANEPVADTDLLETTMTPCRVLIAASTLAIGLSVSPYRSAGSLEGLPGFGIGSRACAQASAVAGAQGCDANVLQYMETARRAGIEYNQRLYEANIAPPMSARNILQDCLGSALDGEPTMFFNFPSLSQILAGLRNQVCSTMRNMVSQATVPMAQNFSMPGRDIGGFQVPGASATVGRAPGSISSGTFSYDQSNGTWGPSSRYTSPQAAPYSGAPSGGFTDTLRNLFR